MKYGVVIVTYNRLELLKECIECVLNQTISAEKIIIVDNASTDGTDSYLKKYQYDSNFIISFSKENSGGAGGFAKGVEIANQLDLDYVLLIDDDAMISLDYIEILMKFMNANQVCPACAGSVCTDGNIIADHRKNVSKVGFIFHNCPIEEYKKSMFWCDNISFCGIFIRSNVMRQIGIPHAYYFIWHDDTEYSIRIRKYGKMAVLPQAVLNHKTKLTFSETPRRYSWKDYYGIRNRLYYLKEHGNFMDQVVNIINLYIHFVFRNYLFSILKIDGYDWKNEKDIAKKAIRDSRINS